MNDQMQYELQLQKEKTSSLEMKLNQQQFEYNQLKIGYQQEIDRIESQLKRRQIIDSHVVEQRAMQIQMKAKEYMNSLINELDSLSKPDELEEDII